MQITCPSCKKLLRVADSAAGKKVKCPACGTTFPALDQVEEVVEPGPPPRKPKPDVVEVVEEAPPRPRRPREDDEDDDRPRRSRARDEDEDDDDRPRRSRRRDEDDDDRPRRSRRRDEEDDDDRPRRRDDYEDEDIDENRGGRKEARRRGKSAALWFLLAGIVSLVTVALSVTSNLVIAATFPAPGIAAYNAGRIAGMIGCGVIGVTGALSHFMASSNLKSFDKKSTVVTAIVFGFIFGVLFGIGVIINLIAVMALPGGFPMLTVLVFIAIIVGATTSFFNLFAAIKGITTLGNRAVKRQFDRR